MVPTPAFEMQFHKGAASGQENGQSDQERNLKNSPQSSLKTLRKSIF
jgi:hypothetical protein